MPRLAEIALRVLGVQANGADVERIFSMSLFIESDRRARARTDVDLYENQVVLNINEDLLVKNLELLLASSSVMV